MKTVKKKAEIFAFHLDGQPIHMRNTKYNGCRLVKRVYFTESAAKAGIKHLPSELKDLVEIVKYIPECSE